MPSFPTWNKGLFAPGRRPAPFRLRPNFKISGVTRDGTGAALASCLVKLFRSSDDTLLATTTSDANGAYLFKMTDSLGVYYVTAYKAGSPVVAGITVDLLV